MRLIKLSAFLILLSVLQGALVLPVGAASFDDPSWPCQQRKVEKLSLGLMWPGAGVKDPDENGEIVLPPDARELADRLELRRTSLEEAEELVADFRERNPGVTADLMLAVFTDIFDRLGITRSKIISGIGRYSAKQIDLAKKIDATRAEMDQLMAESEPDYDRVDQMEEQLDWDERVYRDRARSLTYVCESPVLIEKRLYALAQILLKYTPE